MKYFYFLSISIFFYPSPFTFSTDADAATTESIPTLSLAELQDVQDMSLNLGQATSRPIEKIMEELVDTNVRADSKDPNQFKQKTEVEVKQSTVENKTTSGYKQFTIDLQPNNLNANEPWTGECQVKLYVGFEGCLKNGRMLMFKCSAVCVTLKNRTTYSIPFFLPADICERYGLLSRVPDYRAIHIATDGISQSMIIINRDGKNAHQPNPEEFHIRMKQSSDIQTGIMCNAYQLPPHAGIKPKNHPTLRFSTDM
ncbi:MAG: hypothetical protein LBJ13_00395 [Puniceicoccales bacterium]|jgi:hypothetical protein|nr:hypothetical protein [Puniceicoccales bacterium]